MHKLIECLDNPNLDTFAALIASDGLARSIDTVNQFGSDENRIRFDALMRKWIEHKANPAHAQMAVSMMGYTRVEQSDGRVWLKCGDDFMREHFHSNRSNRMLIALCVLNQETTTHFATMLQWPDFTEDFTGDAHHHYHRTFFERLVEVDRIDFLNVFLNTVDIPSSTQFWRTVTQKSVNEAFAATIIHPCVQQAMANTPDFWTMLVNTHHICLYEDKLDQVWDHIGPTDRTTLLGALVWARMGSNIVNPVDLTPLTKGIQTYNCLSLGAALASALNCCVLELRNYADNEFAHNMMQGLWLRHLQQLDVTELNNFLQARNGAMWNELGLNDCSALTSLILNNCVAPSSLITQRKI